MTMPPLLAGALLMLVGAVVGVSDAVVVKLIASEIHPFEIVFFRNFFSMIALMLLLRGNEWSLNANGLWPIHIMRAGLKLVALAASFFALTMLPLAMVTAIAFTTPIFTVLGSILFLREPPRLSRVFALVLGFIGVMIALRPTTMALGWGTVLALGSAIGLAGVMLLLKVSAQRETGKRVVWFNMVISVPLALLICLPVWTTPSPFAFAVLMVQGVGGLLAQLAVTKAMRLGDASVLVVIDFVRLPLAIILGLLMFSESVDIFVLLGGALIFLAVVILVRLERLVPIQPV